MQTDDETPNVFTPLTLAKRWECSPKHVRNLINKGQLPSFKLGGKLFRIRTADVLAYEDAQRVAVTRPPGHDDF